MNGNINLSPPTPAMAPPASRKATAKVSPPSSKRLRSDLLNKLGIVDVRSQSSLRLPLHPTDSPKKPTKTVLRPSKVTKAPLKKDEGPDLKVHTSQSLLVTLGAFFNVGSPSSAASTASTVMDSHSESSSLSSSSERLSVRRNLTFDEEVSVVHIPRREQYSNRIQQHMWHSTEVLQANVMRNTIEYAADGWKWEDVREEHEHILCRESGELIHPVHQEIARMIRYEQGLPDDAPVWTPFLKQAPIGTCVDTTGGSPREER